MKSPVSVLYSDRDLVFLSIAAWQQQSSQNDIQGKRKKKDVFLLLQHPPNFPTKWSVVNVQEILMNAHHLVKEWQQTPQLSLASIHLLPWCLFKASSAYLFSS